MTKIKSIQLVTAAGAGFEYSIEQPEIDKIYQDLFQISQNDYITTYVVLYKDSRSIRISASCPIVVEEINE